MRPAATLEPVPPAAELRLLAQQADTRLTTYHWVIATNPSYHASMATADREVEALHRKPWFLAACGLCLLLAVAAGVSAL